MAELTEADVLRVMREEWDARVDTLKENIKTHADLNGDGQREELVAPGLKVKHKNSGTLYTVSSVSLRDIILKTPEGDEFLVDVPHFENEYELA